MKFSISFLKLNGSLHANNLDLRSVKLLLSVPWYGIIIIVLTNKKGVILNKVKLSIRDQLEILSYRGSDKDILDIQKEVKKDWLNYLLEKA